jgi:hypothetical protein
MDEEEGGFEGSKPYSDYVGDDELGGELDLDEEEEAEDVLAMKNEHDGDLEMRQYTID